MSFLLFFYHHFLSICEAIGAYLVTYFSFAIENLKINSSWEIHSSKETENPHFTAQCVSRIILPFILKYIEVGAIIMANII